MKLTEIDPLLVDVVLIDILLEDLLFYQLPKSTISDHLKDCFGFLC